ncbi:MAG TPA: hypothetical protein VNH18_12595 [Bryobacteraceae bacterium]|nr:hypothetical protein [Bryobacteraceae bacterium]
MISRTSLRRIVVLAAFIGPLCSLGQTGRVVRLADFIKGVSIPAQTRFKVGDVTVGKTSVMSLFDVSLPGDPSTWDYYTGKRGDVTLRIKSPAHLAQLNQIIALQHASGLAILLRDDRDVFLRRVWGLRDERRFRGIVELGVILPPLPCETITQIVYQTIKDRMTEQLQGETDKRIDLDVIFDKLLGGQIDLFMASLQHVVRPKDPCFKTLQFLKWLKGEEVAGFEFGEYSLNEGLQALVDPVIDALNDSRQRWERYHLNVRIVGYTDPTLVKKKEIDMRPDKTGIDNWSIAGNRLNVWYSGCEDETLTGLAPKYVDFGADRGRRIDGKISNNCQLGASGLMWRWSIS